MPRRAPKAELRGSCCDECPVTPTQNARHIGINESARSAYETRHGCQGEELLIGKMKADGIKLYGNR